MRWVTAFSFEFSARLRVCLQDFRVKVDVFHQKFQTAIAVVVSAPVVHELLVFARQGVKIVLCALVEKHSRWLVLPVLLIVLPSFTPSS